MRDALGAGRVGRASRADYAGGAVPPGPVRGSVLDTSLKVPFWSLLINGPLEYYYLRLRRYPFKIEEK